MLRETPLAEKDCSLVIPPERVVLSIRPHVVTALWPMVVCAALLLLTPAVAEITTGGTRLVGLAVVAVVACWAILRFMEWRVARFVVTDKRVLYRSGVLTFRLVCVNQSFVTGASMSHPISLFRSLEFGRLTLNISGRGTRDFGPFARVDEVLNIVLQQVFPETVGTADPYPRM